MDGPAGYVGRSPLLLRSHLLRLLYESKAQNKAFHRTSHKVRRPVNADVRRKNMNTKYIIFLLAMLLPGWAIAEDSPLPAKLFDVTLDYIHANGPDEDAAFSSL